MILIALGSNLYGEYEDSDAVLRASLYALIENDVYPYKSSSIWHSAPVPASEQPWYRNAVVAVETDLSPVDLLTMLKNIEADFGREDTERNAARILDLDIIAYHGVICTESAPILPHPRMAERAFVLFPLQEIAPDWLHPANGLSVSALVDALSAEDFNPQNIKKISTLSVD